MLPLGVPGSKRQPKGIQKASKRVPKGVQKAWIAYCIAYCFAYCIAYCNVLPIVLPIVFNNGKHGKSKQCRRPTGFFLLGNKYVSPKSTTALLRRSPAGAWFLRKKCVLKTTVHINMLLYIRHRAFRHPGRVWSHVKSSNLQILQAFKEEGDRRSSSLGASTSGPKFTAWPFSRLFLHINVR